MLTIIVVVLLVLWLGGYWGGRPTYGARGWYDPVGVLVAVLIIVALLWLVFGGTL